MSSMESFYDGRQGASFVIVKRFDGIDIPENNVYKVGYFAKDNQDYFIVPLIERNGTNYNDYIYWGTVPKDGVTTVTSQSGVVSDPLPLEYAEGMKQCFAKGGASTSAVGYGEYVIIDTIAGLCQYGSPDNGKIFRRGMNYDSALGGAEYIGQLIGEKGPKGDPGVPGPQGPKGDSGEAGSTGPQGPQGEKGDKGDPGDKGDTGDTGPQGIQGPKGDTGDKGDTGEQGPKGDTGETGPQGPKGDIGITPSITVNASTDALSSSTPTVTVSKSGTDESPVFNLAFSGLKGESGSGTGDMLSSDYDSNNTVKNAGGIAAYVESSAPSYSEGDGIDIEGTTISLDIDYLTASRLGLASVAETGSYNDLTDKPTIPPGVVVDQTYNASSTNAQSGTAVAQAVSGKADTSSLGSAAYKDIPISGNASSIQVVMGNDTRLTDARNAADVSDWAKASTKPTYTANEVGAIPATEKGANNGVATLGSDGKIPSSQLPSDGNIIDDTITSLDKVWSSKKVFDEIDTKLGSIPIANSSTLGGVKIGSNINIAADGTISTHAPYSLPTASSSTKGGITVSDATSNGLYISGTSLYLRSATTSQKGGIYVGNGLSASSGTVRVLEDPNSCIGVSSQGIRVKLNGQHFLDVNESGELTANGEFGTLECSLNTYNSQIIYANRFGEYDIHFSYTSTYNKNWFKYHRTKWAVLKTSDDGIIAYAFVVRQLAYDSNVLLGVMTIPNVSSNMTCTKALIYY